MNRQVITIDPNGGMSGLQRKPGQGIDLRSFGHAEIERASLVEWDADQQAWFVDILQRNNVCMGPLTASGFQRAIDGDDPDFTALRSTLHTLCPAGWGGQSYEATANPADQYFDSNDILIFTDYDDAVKVEIAYLDALRLGGSNAVV